MVCTCVCVCVCVCGRECVRAIRLSSLTRRAYLLSVDICKGGHFVKSNMSRLKSVDIAPGLVISELLCARRTISILGVCGVVMDWGIGLFILTGHKSLHSYMYTGTLDGPVRGSTPRMCILCDHVYCRRVHEC